LRWAWGLRLGAYVNQSGALALADENPNESRSQTFECIRSIDERCCGGKEKRGFFFTHSNRPDEPAARQEETVGGCWRLSTGARRSSNPPGMLKIDDQQKLSSYSFIPQSTQPVTLVSLCLRSMVHLLLYCVIYSILPPWPMCRPSLRVKGTVCVPYRRHLPPKLRMHPSIGRYVCPDSRACTDSAEQATRCHTETPAKPPAEHTAFELSHLSSSLLSPAGIT
jgi:hypothetical protein